MSHQAVIDLREHAEYARGHLSEAHSFPWHSIKRLLCGLPPRSRSLKLVIDDTLDPCEVEDLFTRLAFAALQIVRMSEIPASLLTTEYPCTFCWSPNPFLESSIAFVESLVGVGTALDVGSGTGRDMVYLASRGWAVVGVETRLKLIREGCLLSEKHDMSARVAFLHSDMDDGLAVKRGSMDVINICRFIHRQSMPLLFSLLKPQGVFIYSHFLEGCEKTTVGQPKNSKGFFLNGELEKIFVDAGFCILQKEMKHLADGRPTVNVIARRLA